jgi:hypothetical protein
MFHDIRDAKEITKSKTSRLLAITCVLGLEPRSETKQQRLGDACPTTSAAQLWKLHLSAKVETQRHDFFIYFF